MNFDSQIKLQAYLDGELSERESRRIEKWVSDDPEAQALLSELQAIKIALTDYEPEIKLPESREFFWGKIEREIVKSDAADIPAKKSGVLALLHRYLVPVGVAAAAVAVVVLTTKEFVAIPTHGNKALADSSYVHELETASNEARAMTFRDHSEKVTVVWLSYSQ